MTLENGGQEMPRLDYKQGRCDGLGFSEADHRSFSESFGHHPLSTSRTVVKRDIDVP